jgi:hypothetical protein
MKRVFLIVLLFAPGCSSTDQFHVTAFRTVQGAEAQPWNAGCIATIESSNQRIVGLYGLPCKNIQIGDKAVFNHKGDTTFWVNEIPYTVQSAQLK